MKGFLAILAGIFVLASPTLAAEIDSAYTKIDLDKCTPFESWELGQSWACSGYKEYPVYVAEGDLRMVVSYGVDAPNEMAAQQTLPQFNTINDTLEWRMVRNEEGRWDPFATILRFYTQTGDGSEPDGQVLVVTKLEVGNTCHIAYIDARRVANANEVARQWADDTARHFDCMTDEPFRDPN